jgi:hypothetical protein
MVECGPIMLMVDTTNPITPNLVIWLNLVDDGWIFLSMVDGTQLTNH